MVHSGAEAAEFHRKAARSLVNTVAALDIPTGGLLTFLRNQLSMYDVFACTTSFDTANIQDAIAPNLDDDTVLFNKYLSLLHDVTLCSGQLMEVGTRDWRAEFERARGETLMATGRLPINSASDRRDFIRPVDIHHNAALLYIARRLGHGTEMEAIVAGIYKKISEATGFRHFSDVLSFLEEFWAGGEPDWRQMAKQWENSGRRILAV
ncbi:hypothetical protein FALBO_16325 [Fusarium albosuccineum]|uniref:Uncharacterized protein n=1 Tax=Fusarium albosuccineum TaxID=1237068 RepID=A0A8H4KKQ7_9HYPO|nr:hypothetical protein FALBO_16325 [Fusarium albosuccineum]